MEIHISVRNLVEFLLRSGDIDNRKSGGADNAMLEGARLHRLLQSRMGAGYLPEVSLRYLYDTEKYRIVVEGRADGIFTDESGVTVIDEIKTTYKDIAKLKGPNGVHLAQAKVYAAIYGMKEKQEEMRVRMTYCNVETEEIRYFLKIIPYRSCGTGFWSFYASTGFGRTMNMNGNRYVRTLWKS